MLPDAREWLCRSRHIERAWLLAGAEADAQTVAAAVGDGMAVCAVGQAAAQFPSDLACIVDIETVRDAGEAIARNTGAVAMPEEPHSDGCAIGRTLEAFCDDLPVLRLLRDEGRLLSYPLMTAIGTERVDALVGDLADEEIPLRILVAAGVRMARHLGTRRRDPRSTGFEAMHRIIARTNGGIPALRRTSDLSYGPYGFPVPARVFVGSDDMQMMGVRVLHYSIEKFSTMDVVVEPLDNSRIPVPKDPKNRSKTGFSFCRFDIPRLCAYQGRGIYVDADMQVFTDITDLWTMPLDEADLLYALSHPSQGRTPQTSVMLMNCETLRWDVHEIIGGLDEGRYSYKQLMSELCIIPADRRKPLLPFRWNSLERYEPGRTSLIHYTDMPTQPWVSQNNPNGEVWYGICREALETGFVDAAELHDAVIKGHVSPELPKWIGLPTNDEYDDRAAIWVAGYNRFTKTQAPVEGRVVLSKSGRLRGWAWYPQRPQERVRIGLFDDDRKLFEFTATDHADVLARHGKGDGNYAFDFRVPGAVGSSNAHRLRVATADGTYELPGSPVELIR